MAGNRLRVAIAGCGDAARRHYSPPLVAAAERAEIVGCCDARMDAAEALAAAFRQTSPNAAAFDRLEEMLERTRPQAVFDLTPAPLHAEITSSCLAAGAHVYSEKPLAGSLADADRLIAQARQAGVLLMCAPASAATAQIRWLRDVIASGQLGRPTLAVAQCASMGPASWPEYTGDPTVFYGPGVGPVRDIGIYRLHELTALLGPVRRVWATGTISMPERTIVGGPRAGETVTVTSPDHVLMDLEFAGGALGSVLSSFAVAASRAPRLEVHLTGGSISLGGDGWVPDDALSFYVWPEGSGGPARGGRAAGALGAVHLAPGWNHGLTPPLPPDAFPTVSLGAEHFLACVAGEARPLLTAEHARHVLEIVLLAYESIADGRAHDLQTTF